MASLGPVSATSLKHPVKVRIPELKRSSKVDLRGQINTHGHQASAGQVVAPVRLMSFAGHQSVDAARKATDRFAARDLSDKLGEAGGVRHEVQEEVHSAWDQAQLRSDSLVGPFLESGV